MASEEKNLENSDVFDSWEDLDETDILEKKLKEILPKNDINVDSKRNNKSPVNVILIGDDALRTQYVPPEPTVKILKRPTKDSSMNGDYKPKQPIKTLKQREQEYAEARLRILGEAHSSDTDENLILGIQNKITLIPTRSESENIIRQPRGPDGTKGFTIRR